MSISIVNIVVPTSGDGPITSIANLVGEKTVVLSGTFSGRYVLLGSQDDAHFVPVAFFNSDGRESIEVTLRLALSSVRVRSEAVGSSGVTMNVSGVLSVGANQFATIAAIPAGSSGQQPVIDLDAALPPAGVEQDLGFLCVGSFEGQLVVEGSLDGTHFCPIGSGFKADRRPPSLLGGSQPLEFSPMPTPDLVRYVRVSLSGVASSLVTVTFGGSNPGSGGPSATTTLAQAYANGVISADQTIVLLNTRGGGVVIDGTAGGFTGAYTLDVRGVTHVTTSLAVGVATPTARIHAAAGTAAAGTAPLKIPPGIVLTTPETGAVEADNSHLYWTNNAGARLQLDNAAATTTIAQAYAAGSNPPDQSMVILDSHGGGIIVDGYSGGSGNSCPYILWIAGLGPSLTSNAVVFPHDGGLSTTAQMSKSATEYLVWDMIHFDHSSLTLAGIPTTMNGLAMCHVGQATINGAGNTVIDTYNLLIDPEPNGSATLTRAWSLGVYGNAQFANNACVGWGFYPDASATGALVFASANSAAPVSTTGRVHVLALNFSSGSNLAAVTIAADEPAINGQTPSDYSSGIPLRYNGKNYYLLARDLMPS